MMKLIAFGSFLFLMFACGENKDSDKNPSENATPERPGTGCLTGFGLCSMEPAYRSYSFTGCEKVEGESPFHSYKIVITWTDNNRLRRERKMQADEACTKDLTKEDVEAFVSQTQPDLSTAARDLAMKGYLDALAKSDSVFGDYQYGQDGQRLYKWAGSSAEFKVTVSEDRSVLTIEDLNEARTKTEYPKAK